MKGYVDLQEYGGAAMAETRADGMPLWKDTGGNNVSCTEKVKVLDENYREIREAFANAIDDAVLIGCRAEDIRTIFADLIRKTESSYPDQMPEKKGAEEC